MAAKENNKASKSPWLNAGISFFRRISVFYLFFALSLVFWLLYNYRYIPSNKDELNERGQRILKQLTANFIQKDQEIKRIFDNSQLSDSLDLRKKEQSYGQLNENLRYDIRNHSTANNKIKDSLPFFPLEKDDEGNWNILYKAKTGDSIEINVDNFVRPLLSGRQDVFKSYMLLLEDNNSIHTSDLRIIYRQDVVSSSQYMNADTLFKGRENSDFSTVTQINISGRPYIVFFNPFDFYGTRLMIAGLLPKKDYTGIVTATPLHFIPVSIIIIILIFIFLPFLKTFLLSPRESITSKDVFYTVLSFYIGSAVLCLIIFYVLLMYITGLTFENRLRDFGDKLQSDIETELDQAHKQIRKYDSIDIDSIEVPRLTDSAQSIADKEIMNKKFLPDSFKNILRVLWVNKKGGTIAKWHPFKFVVPLTNVDRQNFFKQYRFVSRGLDISQPPSFTIAYPDKSNATNEFLTIIAEPSQKIFFNDTASIVATAVMLHSSMRPVIPPGFGFSLIDRDGRILIDAQEQRNLSGNIISESGDNPALSEAINHRNKNLVFSVLLYGDSYIARVIPIKNRSFFLVTYYNARILQNNTLRLMHFTVQSLLYIFITVAFCLLISAYDKSTPTRLRFKLNKIDWIRPSSLKNEVHFFTLIYFLFLTAEAILYYYCSLRTTTGLSGVFYMALLLPMYTIWGFIVSRKKAREDKDRFLSGEAASGWEYVFTILWKSIYSFLFILLLNFIIVTLIYKTNDAPLLSYLVLFLCQALAIAFMLACCFRHPVKWFNGKKIVTQNSRNYPHSLILSIFLIGIIPTISIITYGFFAEKMQYKKDKLIKVLNSFQNHNRYLQRDLISKYRDSIPGKLYPDHFNELIYKKGIYLTDSDIISEPLINEPAFLNTGSINKIDTLYSMLMNELYLVNPVPQPFFPINTRAGDSSWYFQLRNRDGISSVILRSDVNTQTQPLQKSVVIQSSLQNLFGDIKMLLPRVEFILIIFVSILIIVGKRIVHGVVKRLFLSDYSLEHKIAVDKKYLEKFFRHETPKTNYLQNFRFPEVIDASFFEKEFLGKPDNQLPFLQEEFIIAMTLSFADVYEKIWKSLSPEEQFTLYDFSDDRFTNYKNSGILFNLIHKGILRSIDENLDFFSLSFRNYILSKKGNPQITRLKLLYTIPGTWESIRMPVLSIIAVVALFIFITQTEFTKTLTAILTSVAALFPLILRALDRSQTGTGRKGD